jgi:hypothetical protein
MKSLQSLLSLSVLTLAATVSLTGCSGFDAAVPLPDTPAQVQPGAIQGNVFGGHAPLVGAHVYLFQAGTSGYGSAATSRLTGANTFVDNGDPNIPSGSYYVKTDATGAFNITGDYTCTANNPVYLYAYGGAPTFPSNSNVFTVNQIVVSNVSSTTPQTATYTFTVTTTENFYIGEPVALTNFPSGTFNFLNGGGTGLDVTVTAANLTTTTFSATIGTNGGDVTEGTYNVSGTATASPGFNPAVVNIAVLGNCPGTSGEFANNIKYVYMNEVATTAAAFALQGFTLPTNNDFVHIGAPSTNLTGIQNAAATASQLYDIQGGNTSTTYAGEGHIARSITPSNNGNVPQALLDTLGNILAACVDSNNTYVAGAGTASPQCSTLFQYATSNGVPHPSTGAPSNAGTAPLDIATAALNIARYPAGSASTSAKEPQWVNTLYTLPTGNVPFAPNLTTQPNDFSVGISFFDPSGVGFFNNASSIAIDAAGNAVFNSTGCVNGCLNDLNGVGIPFNGARNLGTLDAVYESGASASAISTTGSIWTVNGTSDKTNNAAACGTTNYATGTYYVAAATPNGTSSCTGVAELDAGKYYTAPGGVALDGNNIGYIADTSAGVLHKIASPGATSTAFTLNNCTTGLTAIAIDSKAKGYNVWGVSPNDNTVCEISSAGAVINNLSGTSGPTGIAIDANGYGWFTNKNSNIVEVSTPGSYFAFDNNSAALNKPYGIAIDGNNNVWVVNNGTSSLVEFTDSLTATAPTTNGQTLTDTLISPTTGYKGGNLSSPTSLAIDASGNIWVTNPTANTITEIIGTAAPVKTPLSAAALGNQIGAKP